MRSLGMMIASLCMLTGVACAQVPTYPTAFYVSPAGLDTNAGTLAAPFKTIAKALTQMGSTATKLTFVRAGLYAPTSTTTNCTSEAVGVTVANVTLSYYPPDGVGSAIIDGGSTSSSTGNQTGICISASGVTVNGLQVQHSKNEHIVTNATNTHILNNIVHDSYNSSNSGSITMFGTVTGSVAEHNYIYNGSNHGFQIGTNNGSGSIANVVINNNFIRNVCQVQDDCGAIYIIDWTTPRSTNISVHDNYVIDAHSATGNNARGLYLDDGTSNVTLKNNIVTGLFGTATTIHGGSSNTFTNNILDLVDDGEDTLFYQTSSVTGGLTMSGNTFTGNIIVDGFSTANQGYTSDVSAGPVGNLLGITNNAYHSYGGGTMTTTGDSNVGSDASPVLVDPLLKCQTYMFQAGTVPPVSFPANNAWQGTPGYWGPIGFTLPRTGTLPSVPTCTH